MMHYQNSLKVIALFAFGCLLNVEPLEAAINAERLYGARALQTAGGVSQTAPKQTSQKKRRAASRAKKYQATAKRAASAASAQNIASQKAQRAKPAGQRSATKSPVLQTSISARSLAPSRPVASKKSSTKAAPTNPAKATVVKSVAANRKRASSAATLASSAKKNSSRASTGKYVSKKYASRKYASKRNASKKYASRKYASKSYARAKKSPAARTAPRAPISTQVLQAQTSFADIWHETLQDEELMPGVRYKHYIISTGSKHSIHVLEVDRTKPDVAVALWKGQNRASGLERISSIAERADSMKSGVVQGMINANFRRAFAQTPIGPAVINGEVLEMGQFKGWSSCFFDRQNRMYIERFSISATLRTRETSFTIESVNSRAQVNGVALYNRYSGKEIPAHPPLAVGGLENAQSLPAAPVKRGKPSAQAETAVPVVASSIAAFPTEDKLTLKQMQTRLDIQRRMYAAERPMYKAVLMYASQPAINEDIVCRVVEIDTGAVEMPQNGVVVSFGRNIDESELPRPGDKVTLHFKTNIYSGVPFVHAVSGSPRLVRSGVARHEAVQENAAGKAFVSQKLPRTAIGTNANGTTLYFVTADPTDADAGTTGMTLQEIAEGMKQIGAYHAINLDGGPAASMVVRGDVNTVIGADEEISMALGIIQQDPAEQRGAPRRKLIVKPAPKSSTRSELLPLEFPENSVSEPQSSPRPAAKMQRSSSTPRSSERMSRAGEPGADEQKNRQ